MSQKFEPIISDNFNGGEVFSIESVKMLSNQLQKAINVRFKLEEVLQTDLVFEKTLANFSGVGTGRILGLLATETEVYIAVNGKIFVTTDFINSFQIYTGLNTNADVEFLTFQGDIYVMNGVDFPVRIARTTTAIAVIAGSSAALTVKSGQIWRFANSGSVVIVSNNGVETRTYGSTSGDQLTGMSVATFNHPIGSLIFQVISISNAPILDFGTEYKNTWWGAGSPGQTGKTYQENTLFYSRTADGLHPEYFYDFVGAGAGFVPVGDKAGIMGLLKTKTYLLILKKTSIYYCDGFNSNNLPNIQPLTESYGTAGKRTFAGCGDDVITFTGKAIKTIGERENFSNNVPSLNAQFDDKILKKLQELDQNQSRAVLHFNPDQKLLKLCAKQGGNDITFVLDRNIAEEPWSRDTNKPIACAVVFQKETFFGSSTEPKIFQDEVGYSDNGVGIRSEVRLADFNAKSSRLSKCFQYQFLYGLLGEGTGVTVKIYFDDELVQQYTLDDSLITPSGGTPIGRALIGGGIGVSEENAVLGYPFEIERLLKKRRNVGKMSVEFISDGEGQVFEIKGQEINGFYGTKFDRKIRS